MVDRCWVELEGTVNTRDLGGLPLVGGGSTRAGVLLRSDSVQQLTAADVAALAGLGLRTVLDLRTPVEAQREGRGRLANEPVAYHNLPFVADSVIIPPDEPAEAAAPSTSAVVVGERRLDDRVGHYLMYLEQAGDQVAAALRLLADPAARPVLFHCAAGKDRTGVLAALAEEVAGVERDAVVADFTATNDVLPALRARLESMRTYADGVRALSDAQLGMDPAVMVGLLSEVDRRYGGARAWARSAGVTDDELDALAAALRGDG